MTDTIELVVGDAAPPLALLDDDGRAWDLAAAIAAAPRLVLYTFRGGW